MSDWDDQDLRIDEAIQASQEALDRELDAGKSKSQWMAQTRIQVKNHRAQQRLKAARLYAEGLTSDEVAAIIGCSPPSVLNWARLHGVPIRDKGHRGRAKR